ncbi:ureidoglycolate lyase [Bauldia litoralis]|uniref:Ureidoglycolate hydrolase n=1 Tax=Bauldia litoralis TaxID=665467 RepID=A0A1G6DHX1_9HYPH|nr:ureidoglycolate lyase [Bauldia litoralis]SDB44732.1 Ureidoglycolate hydrolase [Bauldia litoralis]
MSVVQIPIEPLTDESFAPFGWLLEAGGEPPFFSRPNLDLWRFPYAADAPARLQIMRYHRQPMRFSRLERHLFVTEARAPLNGARAVLVVAGDAESAGTDRPPSPDTLRAFLIDGAAGVMFWPGVWHGLDCYPLAAHADFIFLSDEATEVEIEALAAPVSGTRTEVADYQDSHGLVFEIVDPRRLMVPPPTNS